MVDYKANLDEPHGHIPDSDLKDFQNQVWPEDNPNFDFEKALGVSKPETPKVSKKRKRQRKRK